MDNNSCSQGHRVVVVGKRVLGKNAELAAQNRQRFRAQGLCVINVLSAPGSGKTTLLERTLTELAPDVRAAVIVGDLATDNDARRLSRSGAPVVQLNTGTVCHLEAEMVARGAAEIDLASIDLLFIENVGNLVCPAAFDLGEDLRVVLMSVTEGEDKPLKYPTLFKTADVVVITKIELAEAAGFERLAVLENIHRIAPRAAVLELSARTGEGLAGWFEALQRHIHVRR